MEGIIQIIEPKIQELTNLEDLQMLVSGDIVCVQGRTLMRYHALENGEICLVGRNGNAIEWVDAKLADLEVKDNLLIIHKSRVDRVSSDSSDYSTLKLYHESNRMLKEEGL